jgi:DtxR family transcriptional regulator, Mn-dependent transcriptional regulator
MHESGEMYLETILLLNEKLDVVRSIDIADEMNFSKASVSRAVKILKEGGFVEDDEKGGLVLTKNGKAIAQKIYDRHKCLTKYFLQIGVDPKIAEEDACRIEHVISDESFNAIKKLVK